MSVVIIDHGLCNVGSARRAFEECGAKVFVTDDPASLADATHIVLPGVGAFNAGMAQLHAQGWVEPLRRAVKEKGIPILGICLGMQLLADRGHEGGDAEGLGLIPGEVVRLAPGPGERVPHVGWNDVTVERASVLFGSIPTGTDFYFVHSFHLVTTRAEDRVASVPCCGGISAAVESGGVYGVQFHPEKSSKAGFRLIRNFLEA
ncbi:imidazole glycerol phosphate synthase subunit HisH [soil metagenome]